MRGGSGKEANKCFAPYPLRHATAQEKGGKGLFASLQEERKGSWREEEDE